MEEKNTQDALVQLALDSAKENKHHAKSWLIAFIVSNVLWAIAVVVIVISFFDFESQFQYETSETTETTVYQDTGEGSGNNIYQAGEHATYNEGGGMNGEADNQYENDKDSKESEGG